MILSKFKKIRCIVLDVDGVLTDGTILVTESGEFLRSFNVKDGYAIQLAVKRGLKVFVISGGQSEGVLERMKRLGVDQIHLGISNKLSLLQKISSSEGLKPDEILFVGDDIPDLESMRWCGVSVCPADAAEDIKKISSFISPFKGGKGVVRDIIEKILKLQDNWVADKYVKSI